MSTFTSTSTSCPHTGQLRRLLSVGAVLAALLGTQVAVAAVASAHDELESSTPTADAALTAPPQEVTLTFSEPVNAEFSEVVVSAPGGASVTVGDPQVAGGVLTQPLAALSESGTYRVAWRVVSGDGHPISGEFAFSLAVPAAVTPSATAEATTGAATETATGSTSTAGQSAPPPPPTGSSEVVVSAEVSSASTEDGGSNGPVIGLVAVLVIAVAIGGVLAARRRRDGVS